MDPRLLAFVAVAALLTMSPGPDMALVLRNALTRGRDAVLPTAAGTCSGCMAWGAASSVGIAAVLNTSAQLYDTLRLAGAAYLVFLGVRTLWDVWGRRANASDELGEASGPVAGGAAAGGAAAGGAAAGGAAAGVSAGGAAAGGKSGADTGVDAGTPTRPRGPVGSRRSAYRQGLLTNLLNPKVGIFYTTFLPQFIAPGEPAFLMSVALASIHAGMNLVWLTAYGRAAVRLGDVIRRGRVRKAIETASGTVLVAIGLAVAVERR